MKLFRFLTLIAAACLLFSSCAGETEAPADTTIAEETAPAAEPYTVVANGASDFVIIRPDSMDERALNAILNFRKTIKEKYSVDITVKTDWSKENKDNNTVTSDESVLEILIGDTNRAETRALAEEYPDLKCGYVIKAINGKIVIWGTDTASLTSAIDLFVAEMLGEGSITVPGDYLRVWDLSGEGMPLDLIANNYTIICPQGAPDRVWNAANLFAKNIEALSGVKPAVQADSKSSASGKEILIGNTNRAESAAVGEILYMDYTIRISGDKIVLLGGSPLATQSAVESFFTMIKSGSISTLDEDFEYSSNYHELIADSIALNIDSFVPKWASEFTVPAWMTDFEEKLYALTTPSGRMASDSHRGDVQNYPENSIPGILSAIMLGADVVEIDIRLTKDNIMVLMHDASLKRTTDWSQKKGKNGLPTSDQIEDWTYEELRELRLLYNGKASDCIIPTMYEAALLFAGRAQIHFDCKVDNIDVNSDVFLLAEATDSKECFIYYYGLSAMTRWQSLDKSDEDFKQFVVKMNKYLSMSGHALRKRNFEMIEKHGDHTEGWKKAWDEGYKMTFTNKIYDFSKYLAANEGPIALP